MSKLDEIRAWPQRKKMNLIWTVTGSAIVLMIILWIIIGNYHNSSATASSTIGTLISNITNSSKGK